MTGSSKSNHRLSHNFRVWEKTLTAKIFLGTAMEDPRVWKEYELGSCIGAN